MAATLRKYINISPSSDVSSDDLGKAFKKMTIAHNRMGGAITNIGVQLTEFKELIGMYQESTVGFLEQEKDISEKESKHRKEIIKAKSSLLNRKEGLQQDKLAEKKQETLNEKGEEKLGEEEGKKEKKSRFGWLKGLLKPMTLLIGGLVKLVAIPVLLGVMDWLGDPENTEKIKKVLGFFVAVWKFANFFTRMGVGLVMDGITDVFGHDPDKGMIGGALDKMFGVLKILAGLASIHLATRILMPWKLIGDIKFMFGLGRAVKAAESAGCGPNRRRPRNRRRTPGRDGRTARQRLKDMNRAKRLRRIKALRGKITQKFASAATRINGLFKKPPVPAVKPKPVSPFQQAQGQKAATQRLTTGVATDVVEEGSEKLAKAAATNKGVTGVLRNLWGGVVDAGAVAKTKLKEGGSFALKQVGRLNNWFGTRAAGLIDNVKGMGQGIWDFGKRAGKSLGDVVEMAKNPKALAAKVTTKVKDFIKPVLEKNPQVKQIQEFAGLPKGQQVKQAGKSVWGFLKSGFKNPGFKTMREFLGAAKSSMKIGGIDTLIASIMALLDYGVFGESPINAVLKALGGLLGYSAGFAIGAPFGGVPGFVTGAAGGFAGEWAAEQLLGLLAKTGLKDIDDPIAEAIGGDFAKRKIVRDPKEGMPGMEALMGAAENDGDGTEEIKPPELPEMAKGGLLKFNGGGEYSPEGAPKHPGMKKRLEHIRKMKQFAAGGELAKLGDGTALVNAAAGMCTTGVILTAEANNASIGKPHVATGNDPNNPRGLMAQAVGEHGYGSIGGLGEAKAITSPYGNVSVNVMDLATWTQAVKDKAIPSGSLIFSTRHSDWNNAASSSGNDSAIAKEGGQKLWSGHWQARQNGVGAVYGGGTKGIVALTHPGGNNVGYDGKTDNVSPSDASNGNTGSNAGGDASGGGQPSAAEEYRTTGSIVDFFKKSAGILGSYAKDTTKMGGGGSITVPTTTSMPDAKTSGIGPLADGGAYAESLKPAAKVSAPPSKINTTADKLSSLSTSKVRRDKAPSKPNMMIAVQPVVKTNTVNAGGGGGTTSPSSSPLLTK